MMAAGMKNGEMRPGPPSSSLHMLALDDVESADAGGDVDAGGVGDVGRDFELSHAHGEIGAGHGQLNEPAHFFQLFFGDPEERIEIVDLGGDAAIECGGVKMSDGARRRFGRREVSPRPGRCRCPGHRPIRHPLPRPDGSTWKSPLVESSADYFLA